MNPMADAIKKKRMKPEIEIEVHSDNADEEQAEGKDLHGFVKSLSPDEKMQLKELLHKDQGEKHIAEGGASQEEQAKISQQMSQENTELGEESQEAPGISEDQSDEIGKSMLESKYRNGPIEGKPRGLGDRVKGMIAGKLKAKGKL